MSILHVKSDTIGDFTGTVTAFDSAGNAVSVAATDLVRPSDWNSVHNHKITLTGNTFSNSTASGTNIIWAGSGGISVGGSGASVIISGNTGGGGGSVNFSAGTTSNNLGSVVFSNSNGVSFGLNGSTITGSISTSLTNINVSAGAASANLSNLVFSNSNGVTFGLNGSTITATVQPGAAAGIAAIQAGTQTATSGTVVFANSNGISFAMSGSSQITASYTVPSTAGLISAVNVSAGTTSNNLSALTFSNSNNVSFGLSGSVITASASGAGGAGGVGIGITNSGNTAGTSGTVTTGNYILFGSNAVTLSQSSSGSNGSLTINVPKVVGVQGINVSTDSNNYSVGQGTGTLWFPQSQAVYMTQAITQGSIQFQEVGPPGPVQFDRAAIGVLFTNATNSTGSVTVSGWMGFYTKNAGSLSLEHSSSTTLGLSFQGNQSASTQSLWGYRWLTMGWTTTLENQGQWYVGILMSTASAGANASLSQIVGSNFGTAFSGNLGSVSAASNQYVPGAGFFSVTTNALPASLGFSDIVGNVVQALRPLVWMVRSGTE